MARDSSLLKIAKNRNINISMKGCKRFKSQKGNLTNSPIDKPSKTMFVDHELFALKVKNMIERKGLVFSEDDLWVPWGNVSTNSTHINSFRSALWTNPI